MSTDGHGLARGSHECLVHGVKHLDNPQSDCISSQMKLGSQLRVAVWRDNTSSLSAILLPNTLCDVVVSSV